jgi:diazepam-binding inhibitor (GABA receptor modulating acyl-CoA-binding protein)
MAMSTNINELFAQATLDAQKLVSILDDDTLLTLYSFYKQAIVGDINTEKPSFFNFKDTKKWNAWSLLKGMSKLHAQGMYIKSIKDIQSRYK